MTDMMQKYDEIYESGLSRRYTDEGLIAIRYRLPKYMSYLFKLYSGKGPLSVLEIGGGGGEMHDLIMNNNPDFIKDYTVVEYSAVAAERMRKRGVRAFTMDACQLGFKTNSFDLVFCFDVLHHAHSPEIMASEIVRVTRKYFYLCEANGLSVIRKMGEMNKEARMLGERSYTPGRYVGFFQKSELKYIKTHPFYLFVVPRIREILIPFTVRYSEFLEKIPLVRWQGLSLLIHGEKK